MHTFIVNIYAMCWTLAHCTLIFVYRNKRNKGKMKLYDFISRFPNEDACKEHFLVVRKKNGVKCPKCGCEHNTYLPSRTKFECKDCGCRFSLRSGTALEGSKLPYRYWFIAIHLLTATKHTFSSSEIQRQLGHKRYQPIWEMVHKIRSVMGKRDAEYNLAGYVELDEGFFTTEKPKNMAKYSRARKAKVMVMAESSPVVNPKPNAKVKKIGHIKMLVVPDVKMETLFSVAENNIYEDAVITMDASHNHSMIEDKYDCICEKCISQWDVDELLPWVHTTISNAKSLLLDTYHGIKEEFLQEYLSEFCYKFNRRYFGEGLFDRVIDICVLYNTEFHHRPYRKARIVNVSDEMAA